MDLSKLFSTFSLRVFRFLCVLCVFCGATAGFALDRDAFTFTKYDLEVRLDPESHQLAARGKITLRNDSAEPQKNRCSTDFVRA